MTKQRVEDGTEILRTTEDDKYTYHIGTGRLVIISQDWGEGGNNSIDITEKTDPIVMTFTKSEIEATGLGVFGFDNIVPMLARLGWERGKELREEVLESARIRGRRFMPEDLL